MMVKKLSSTLFALTSLGIALSLTACSARSTYNSIQISNQNECRRMVGSAYEECMARNSKSYEEYERERQELLKENAEEE